MLPHPLQAARDRLPSRCAPPQRTDATTQPLTILSQTGVEFEVGWKQEFVQEKRGNWKLWGACGWPGDRPAVTPGMMMQIVLCGQDNKSHAPRIEHAPCRRDARLSVTRRMPTPRPMQACAPPVRFQSRLVR